MTNARSAKQDEFYTQYVDIQKEVEAYAVLHDPVYRETYALNLKREFPHIPFYPVFAQCVRWGEALMAMHISYEDVAPWPVERVDSPKSSPSLSRGGGPPPKVVVEGASGDTPPSRASRAPPPRDKLGEDFIAPKPILKSKPEEGRWWSMPTRRSPTSRVKRGTIA